MNLTQLVPFIPLGIVILLIAIILVILLTMLLRDTET